MATFGYKRVSTEKQEDNSSLDHQETKIRGLCMMQGLSEPVFFEDVCSGSIPLGERPGGKALLAALKPGDSLVVLKLDRVFRNATDALTQADQFKARGINLYLIDMGADPVTNNGVARMFFGMLALMAEFERERIRDRTVEGRTVKKGKGGHVGGSRPFGYWVVGSGKSATLVPNEEEQEAIYEARVMRARGASLRTIADALKAKGHSVSHVAVSRIVREG